MSRRGDGIYRRGRVWYFDAVINGKRYVERIGKDISRTVAAEIAGVRRAAILRGEAGIGRRRKDISFEQAKQLFIAWAATTLKPRTVESYTECLKRLSESMLFAGKRLGQITTWTLERYKQERAPKARVRVNRELAVLKAVFNRMRDWKKYDGPNPVEEVTYLIWNDPPVKRRSSVVGCFSSFLVDGSFEGRTRRRALRRRVTLIFAGCPSATRAEPHDRAPSGGDAV